MKLPHIKIKMPWQKTPTQLCLEGVKHVAIWSGVLFCGAALLFAGVLVRLSYKPYDLSEYLPAMEELLYTPSIGGVQLDDLTLGFDGDFNLIGTGVLFVGPENKPVASALQMKLSVALRSVLVGEIGFKKVLLDGLAVRITQGENHLTVGTYVIPRGQTTPEQGATPDKKSLSAISIISKIDDISYLKYLEVFDIKNTMLALTLADERFKVWNFSDTDLSFLRQAGVGERMSLTGLLKPGDDGTVPFYGSFEHRAGEDTAYVTTRFEALNSRLFSTFLPEEQRNIVDADIKTLEIRSTLDRENTIRNAEVEANIGRGELRLPQLYGEIKPFRSAVVDIVAEPKDGTTSLNIKNLVVDMSDDLLLNGEGELRIAKDPKDLYANISLSLMPAPLSSVMKLLPDMRMAHTMEWLQTNLNYQEVAISNLKAQLTGYLRDFPFENTQQQTNNSRFSIDFDFDNVTAHTVNGFPEITQAAGHGALTSDELIISSEEGGQFKDQQAQNVHAVISGLFSKQAVLRLHTEITGEAQKALNIIFDRQKVAPIVTGVVGTHKTVLEVNAPLDGKPEDATFEATTILSNVALNLPFINKPFKADTLEVKTNDKGVEIKGKGQVNPFEEAWWPVDFGWHEDLNAFGHHTAIEGTLQTNGTPMPAVFPKLGLSIEGPLNHHFAVKRHGDKQPYDINVNTDLVTGKIVSTSFEWSKDANIPGRFEMQAELAPDASYIDLQNLALRAPGAEVMGAFYGKITPEGKVSDVSFSFDPFIIGATNASITYRDQNYSLIGESFNFSKIGSGELNTDIPVEDGKYTIDLRQLTFKGGKFENVLGYITRTDNAWDRFDVKALVGKNRSPLTIQLISGDEGDNKRRRFEVFSGDAGAALKALNVYKNLESGRLEAVLNISHEYSAFGFDADGQITIEDAYMKNAPVMARLLSLVSLQQILNAEKGIAFERINLPLLMDDRVLRVRKGRLIGPNIRLNLAGHVDFANNKMKFNGSLIPATAVNTVINNIPILGPVITGSQGALVAADFSVKGSIDKPDVSANPLSLVTPGILKDIWQGITGDGEE